MSASGQDVVQPVRSVLTPWSNTMRLTWVHEPTAEPITVQDAKNFLRLDVGIYDDDSLIASLIAAARHDAENEIHRQLCPATIRLRLDRFPSERWFDLPRAAPLSSVTGVYYYDTAGVQQTLELTDRYLVDSDAEPARIYLPYGIPWPPVYLQAGSVWAEYVCGYAAGTIPAGILQWIRMRVATLYTHREGVITGTIVAELPRSFLDGLLDDHRIPSYE